jgi:carboxylate-amine ligase
VFRRFPRSGIPDQFESWSAYEDYVNTLVELHCIDNGKKLWWDLRPHPQFGTLEFRICDVPTSPQRDDRARGAAQAIVVKLYRLRRSNLGFRIYPRALSKRTSGAPRATASTGG